MPEDIQKKHVEVNSAGSEAQGWDSLAQDVTQNWAMDHPGVAALYENHVVPQLKKRGLGHLAVTDKDESDADLLHGRDAKTHLISDVEHSVDYLRQQGNRVPNEPRNKLAAYMNLAKDIDYINDGILTGDKESIARQVEANVIKGEEVPESYFENMRQILHNEGYGDVDIPEDVRETTISEIQSAQKFSLEEWATYLGETKDYPDGFKLYVWDSILKLKPFDPYKESFPKRSKGTVAPYPMFNPDAVEKVFEAVKSGDKRSFSHLYSEAIHSLDYFDPELLTTVEGRWRTFERSNEPAAAKELSDTLNEKTGWCVAQESYAGHYLQSGDFLVYYTVGKDGEYNVPRVAIATSGKRIREIRGILPGQIVEPHMLDIAYSKASELPGGEKFLGTREDMKRVTRLFELVEKDPSTSLSVNDLRFIYEFDRAIQSPDNIRDPRIDEIIQSRDWAADMMAVHGVENHKELFDAILTQSREAYALPTLLKEKKRHHVFGYSLNRQEKENKRLKELASRQVKTLEANLPYLSLDLDAADKLIAFNKYEGVIQVVNNPHTFGFSDTKECIEMIVDKGHVKDLLFQHLLGGNGLDDSVRDNLSSLIATVMLEKGKEHEVLRSTRDETMRFPAVHKVISKLDIERDIPEGEYKSEVRDAIINLISGLKNGELGHRIILPTIDDVTQFERLLSKYLEENDIYSDIFTPNKQRDLEIKVNKPYYTYQRHGDGTIANGFRDVAIIDRADLRAGDLLFRNAVRGYPNKIVISVATKLFPTAKFLQDIDNLAMLSKAEVESLEPEQAAELYNALLAKEGLPEELSDENPIPDSELENVSKDQVLKIT